MRSWARPDPLLIAVAALLLASCRGANDNPPLTAATPLQSRSAKAARQFRDLYVFCHDYPSCADGGEPSGPLTLSTTGAMYGTLSIGGLGEGCGSGLGCGAVFELAPSGSRYAETLLYSFCPKQGCHDGYSPAGALAFDALGNLYGTTTAGGHKNGGVVFELAHSGSSYAERVLYEFCEAPHCSDGKTPSAGLVFDTKGALYGTTTSGGHKNGGVVFKLTPSASGYTESIVYSFCRIPKCADGQTPSAGITFDAAGALYSTTASGGAYDFGTVFKLAPPSSGYTESVLYSFCQKPNCIDGAHPHAGVVFNQHGAIYGTTSAGGIAGCWLGNDGCGTVFRLTPSGTAYQHSVLHKFCRDIYACVDGAHPSGVVFNKKGALYGTTSTGGRYDQQGYGGGLIFRMAPSGSRYKYDVPYYFGRNGSSFHPNTTPVLGTDGAVFGTSTGIIPIRGPLQGTVWELQSKH